MSKTKEIEIRCNEVRIVPDGYKKVKIIVDAPEIDVLLQSIEWSDILTFVQSENPKPEDVFSEEQLEKWAESIGYIKE